MRKGYEDIHSSIGDIGQYAGTWSGCALTVGNFDGVHLGHQAILSRLSRYAKGQGVPVVALTFEPHPARFFRPESPPFRLTTPQQKAHLLRVHGVAATIFITFDTPLSQLEPEAFIREVLHGVFQPGLIVVGSDFNFGRGRRGTPETLRECGTELGMDVQICEPQELDGAVISSSRIRRAIREGDVRLARRLLGRHFALLGQVVHGEGRGRQLGFPTANVEAGVEVLPAHGVYATVLETEEAMWQGITNVGVRPTFQGEGVTIETFILDPRAPAHLDLYGETVAVHLVDRIREERRFETPAQLVAQIERDLERCREIHGRVAGDIEQRVWLV